MYSTMSVRSWFERSMRRLIRSASAGSIFGVADDVFEVPLDRVDPVLEVEQVVERACFVGILDGDGPRRRSGGIIVDGAAENRVGVWGKHSFSKVYCWVPLLQFRRKVLPLSGMEPKTKIMIFSRTAIFLAAIFVHSRIGRPAGRAAQEPPHARRVRRALQVHRRGPHGALRHPGQHHHGAGHPRIGLRQQPPLGRSRTTISASSASAAGRARRSSTTTTPRANASAPTHRSRPRSSTMRTSSTGSPRYDSLFAYPSSDYKSWARGLKAAGYATAPDYAQRLVRIIEEHELYLLDRNDGERLYASRTGGIAPIPRRGSPSRRASRRPRHRLR